MKEKRKNIRKKLMRPQNAYEQKAPSILQTKTWYIITRFKEKILYSQQTKVWLNIAVSQESNLLS